MRDLDPGDTIRHIDRFDGTREPRHAGLFLNADVVHVGANTVWVTHRGSSLPLSRGGVKVVVRRPR